MPVLMMHVRHVRVAVPHSDMPICVRVGLAGRIFRQMHVLVMLIVHVSMGVFHRLMLVLVFMMLGQVQPDAGTHQKTGRQELERQWLS